MPSLWDIIPAAGQGPGVVPKAPSPFPDYGEQNPLVSALMKEPSVPNPADPPVWMRQAIIDAIRPVLDAGQWLGGVIGGNVQPTMGDAVTNLGGAALAGIMPPGARAPAMAERAAEPLAQMAEHGIFDLINPLGQGKYHVVKTPDGISMVVIPTEGGKHLHIESAVGGEGNFGVAGVRRAQQQLQELYPDAETIGGRRIGGARLQSGTENKNVRVPIQK